MKQIELYLSLSDYFNSIKNRDHSVMNVSQVGDVGEEDYRYDRVVLTSESNPVLLNIALAAGWNYTFPDKVTLQELSMLSMDDIRNNIAGNTALTNFNEFQYFTSVAFITNDMFSGCSSLTSITVPQSVVAVVADAFSTCSPNIRITYLNPDIEIIYDSVKKIRVNYSIPTSRWDSSKVLFRANENLVNTSIVAILDDYNELAEEKLKNPVYKAGFKPVVGVNNIKFDSGETSTGVERLEFSFVLFLKSGDISLPEKFMSDSSSYGVGLVGPLELPDGITSIGNSAFCGNSGLTSIVFENGGENIRMIGNSAFAHCQGLTNFMIPQNVTSLGNSAFSRCDALTSITIGNKVESLGSGCFSECRQLTSITIPSSVTELKDGCFSACTGLTTINISGNNLKTIGAYCFSRAVALTSFTIPDSVETVSGACFFLCSSLKSLTIGSSVTVFEAFSSASGFNGCDSLSSVTINDGCLFIWPAAFRYLKSLKTVSIPSSVLCFRANAFYMCEQLTGITIPSGVVRLDEWCFCGCKSLTNLVIPQDVYRLESGFCQDCTSLTSVTFPYGIAYIGLSAFSGCFSLKSLNLPDTVRGLSDAAFGRCISLSSITIPENVCSISMRSFGGCYVYEFINNSLYDRVANDSSNGGATLMDSGYQTSNGIIIKDNNVIRALGGFTNITIPNGVTGISDSAFSYLDIVSISLPSTLKEIGDAAFWGCTKLTSITIPNSVEKIGSRAFYECTSLSDATVGSGVTDFGEYIFQRCVSLTGITLTEGLKTLGYAMFAGDTYGYSVASACPFTSITIPSSIVTIPGYCFSLAKSLSSITFTNGIDQLAIEECAFSGTPFLNLSGKSTNYITYLGNIAYQAYYTSYTSYTLKSGTVSIAGGCFSGCSRMTAITIPDSVTRIGSNAFIYASGMTSITIPNSVTEIGDKAFMYCSNLSNINISNNLVKMGNGAFWGCTSLNSITLPESLVHIGASAFTRCSSLTGFTVPKNVEYLGFSCFSSCSSLSDFSFGENHNPLKIGGALFLGCGALSSITFPENITEVVETGNWAWEGMFNGCSGLTSVVFEGANTKFTTSNIGNETTSMFYSLTSLTSVTLPSNLQYLPKRMFWDCRNLQTVALPSSLTGIGAYCFSGSGIVSINLPNGLKEIGDYAFACCGSLTSLTIPDSVTALGYNYIIACGSLTSLSLGSGLTIMPDQSYHSTRIPLTSLTLSNTITGVSPYLSWLDNTPFIVCGYCETYGGIYYLNDNLAYKCVSTGLTEYTFKNTTTVICSACCYNCKNMTAITIPSSVVQIGYDAFGNCTGLQEVIANGATNVTVSGNNIYSEYANGFHGAPNITTVRGTYATSDNKMLIRDGNLLFVAPKNLTSLVIPSSITVVCSNLCKDNTSITSVTIPSNVTNIGRHAFSGCKNITNVTFDSPCNIQRIPEWCFYSCGKLTGITIPDTVTKIDEYAFCTCSAMTQLNLGDGLEVVGSYSFDGCKNIRTLNLPDSLKLASGHSFSNLGITTLKLPKKAYCASETFYGCSGLTSVTYDQNCEIKELQNIFNRCTGLTSFSVPNSVRELYNTFSNMTGLTEVTFDTVNSRLSVINYYAFAYSKISNINLPGRYLILLGESIFRYNEQLTGITFNGLIEPKFSYYTFRGLGSNGTFYYPKNGFYKNTLNPDGDGPAHYGWTGIPFTP